MKHASILCLGDSYTIGEGVPLHQSFPYQTVQWIRKAGHRVFAPEIIAKTGWTTFELAEHLLHHSLDEQYDIVTLLIGVNNQYRGLSIADFESDIDFLMHKALHVTKQMPAHIIVISIPDWGVTPFAVERNTNAKQVTNEIDAYNAICEAKAQQYQANFINITTPQRIDGADLDFLAADQLHPSAKEYGKWAEQVAGKIVDILG